MPSIIHHRGRWSNRRVVPNRVRITAATTIDTTSTATVNTTPSATATAPTAAATNYAKGNGARQPSERGHGISLPKIHSRTLAMQELRETQRVFIARGKSIGRRTMH